MAEPRVVLAMAPSVRDLALTEAHWTRLRSIADVLDPEPLTSYDGARAHDVLGCADVLLTHWAAPAVDRRALDRAPRLRLIAHAAGTVRHVTTPAVWERGVQVTSAAAAGAPPVAAFALAAILLADKDALRLRLTPESPRLGPSLAHLRGDRPRVGVVGASLVGRALIERLRPFGFDVAVHDPYLNASGAAELGVAPVDLAELFATCGIVSIHAPELPATYRMVDAGLLARLPDGAWLINTARGSIVDTDALVAEAATGRINAVLDVTDPEPLPRDHPLLTLPNVWVTPHIAGARGRDLHRMTDLAIDEVERFARGEPPRHPVTREDLERIA